MVSQKELVESLIHKYERYVAPFTFIGGFLIDTILLRRIDLWFDHLILLGYLLIAGFSIVALNAYEAGRIRFRHFESIAPLLPVIMQFVFGGLFSFFLIFYTKSGTVSASWLFLLVLITIFLGNERFRKRYERLVFQLSIYFIVLFSYSIFAVPLIIRKMGAGIFVISGAVSLVLIGAFIFALSLLLSKQVRESFCALLISIGGIFLVFNILYFTNIIPPIPLAIKEIGVYHSVRRFSSDTYEVRYEKALWFMPFETTSHTYHWKKGEAVYVYSAVFAPAKLNIPILHRWARFDEKQQKWIELESIKFSIYGGRDGGYRGYSYKTVVEPGKWRVDVITERGQVLGRQSFSIVEVDSDPSLETTLY